MKLDIPPDLVEMMEIQGLDVKTFVHVCVSYGLQLTNTQPKYEELKRELSGLMRRQLERPTKETGLRISDVQGAMSTFKKDMRKQGHIRAGIRSAIECSNALTLAVESGLISEETKVKAWDLFHGQFG